MRVGHLIEDDDGPVGIAAQNFIEMDIFQRRAFENQPLVRRILCNKPRQILHIGIFQREVFWQFTIKRFDGFARGP